MFVGWEIDVVLVGICSCCSMYCCNCSCSCDGCGVGCGDGLIFCCLL